MDWLAIRKAPSLTAILLISLLISACGGGSGGGDNDDDTGGDTPDPAPQTRVSAVVIEQNQQLTLRWEPVEGAERYHAYLATEPGLDPEQYTASPGGTMFTTTETQLTIDDLSNATPYYLTMTSEHDGQEYIGSQDIVVAPGPLNDTGASSCADAADMDLDCPVTDFPNQDAEQGRDARQRSGTLAKIGTGNAAFDYTKLGTDGLALTEQGLAWDESGNEVEGSSWSCVRDNRTGLVWEVKHHDPEHLRHNEHTYSWYSDAERSDGTTGAMNGGAPGVANNGTCHNKRSDENPEGNDCDTAGYVAALNQVAHCGITSWRMPTRQELLSLVDHGSSSPAIDSHFFPNTRATWTRAATPLAIYSSETGDGLPPAGTIAWTISFSHGQASVFTSVEDGTVVFDKSAPLPVRLVSGTQ